MSARWPGRLNESRRGYAARHHAQLAERPTPAAERPGRPPASTPTAPARYGPTLYQKVLRQAIASQHRLAPSDRQELRACEGCGKPYLLTSIWQPISDEGSIACPRCGTEAVNWDGARSYVAYWQRESEANPRGGLSRPPN
jgi:uncharacterized Zn-finger protein